MGEQSIIAWTNNTFNPWIGCVKISDGCKHCYAETMVKGRMNRPGLWGPEKTAKRARTAEGNWRKPVNWNADAAAARKRMRVFSGSLCDVFEDHADANAARPDLWNLIRKTPWLDWQLLTKRADNIEEMLPDDWDQDTGWNNVWLGVSVEDMRVADRVDALRKIPAVVRFISYEPALGPLDDLDISHIDWIIYGGESGPKYRHEDKDWARSMHRKCEEEGVAFFHKQSSGIRTEMGIELDGRIVREYPEPRAGKVYKASLFA